MCWCCCWHCCCGYTAIRHPAHTPHAPRRPTTPRTPTTFLTPHDAPTTPSLSFNLIGSINGIPTEYYMYTVLDMDGDTKYEYNIFTSLPEVSEPASSAP